MRKILDVRVYLDSVCAVCMWVLMCTTYIISKKENVQLCSVVVVVLVLVLVLVVLALVLVLVLVVANLLL